MYVELGVPNVKWIAFKVRDAKRFIGLEVHQVGNKEVDFLE